VPDVRRGVVGAALALVVLTAGCGAHAPPSRTLSFHSRPDLTPPVVIVHASSAAAAPGYLFIAPKRGAIQKGPEIVDDRGRPVWFQPVPAQATDFRVQTYRGRPVLTWWQGPIGAPVPGTGVGHWVIMDEHYHQIATVDGGVGPDTADLHELLLTARETAIVTAYRVVPYDLSRLGGPKNGSVADSIVREIDLATGQVLFTWHSLGHVALSESYADIPEPKNGHAAEPYDYFHVNAVAEEPDGNLLVTARNTWAVYEIDRRTGSVLWRLGGKRSNFYMGPGTNFAWAHDARRAADGTITIFDDEGSPDGGDESRGLRIRLDLRRKTATFVQEDVAPDRVLASSQGNMQQLANGDVLVGWGAVPRVTEFDRSGKVVFDASFAPADDSYRAYRFEWTGLPTTRPAIAVDRGDGDARDVYASWNGATEVRAWRVIAGLTAERLQPVGPAVKRQGFETHLPVSTDAPLYAVQALGAGGNVLGTSPAVAPGGRAIG
jgi:hypothetical protein